MCVSELTDHGGEDGGDADHVAKDPEANGQAHDPGLWREEEERRRIITAALSRGAQPPSDGKARSDRESQERNWVRRDLRGRRRILKMRAMRLSSRVSGPRAFRRSRATPGASGVSCSRDGKREGEKQRRGAGVSRALRSRWGGSGGVGRGRQEVKGARLDLWRRELVDDVGGHEEAAEGRDAGGDEPGDPAPQSGGGDAQLSHSAQLSPAASNHTGTRGRDGCPRHVTTARVSPAPRAQAGAGLQSHRALCMRDAPRVAQGHAGDLRGELEREEVLGGCSHEHGGGVGAALELGLDEERPELARGGAGEGARLADGSEGRDGRGPGGRGGGCETGERQVGDSAWREECRGRRRGLCARARLLGERGDDRQKHPAGAGGGAGHCRRDEGLCSHEAVRKAQGGLAHGGDEDVRDAVAQAGLDEAARSGCAGAAVGDERRGERRSRW